MFDTITDSIASALSGNGINAVTKFPVSKLNRAETLVCVSIKSARITASGLGNYIGLCTQNGTVKEMYGSMAELQIAADIYSPFDEDSSEPGCAKYAALVEDKIRSVQGLSVTEFNFGDIRYDTAAEMFHSACTVKAGAYLVRELLGGELSSYGLGETV